MYTNQLVYLLRFFVHTLFCKQVIGCKLYTKLTGSMHTNWLVCTYIPKIRTYRNISIISYRYMFIPYGPCHYSLDFFSFKFPELLQTHCLAIYFLFSINFYRKGLKHVMGMEWRNSDSNRAVASKISNYEKVSCTEKWESRKPLSQDI